MSNPFYIKQNDSRPKIATQLKDGAGEPIDISGYEAVYFHMEEQDSEEVIIEKEAEVVNAEKGEIQYNWDRGDTSEHGVFHCEWMVDFGEGEVETFPNDGYNIVIITRQIAGAYEE